MYIPYKNSLEDFWGMVFFASFLTLHWFMSYCNPSCTKKREWRGECDYTSVCVLCVECGGEKMTLDAQFCYSPFIIFIKSLSQNLNLQPASCSDCLVSSLYSTGATGIHKAIPRILCGLQEFEHKSSCLNCKISYLLNHLCSNSQWIS